MAALNTAEQLPERADYSISHRPPPAIPTVPYSSLPEAVAGSEAGHVHESDALNNQKTRRRGGSFGQLFRLNSSSKHLPSSADDVPPLPSNPASPYDLNPASPETGKKNSFSATRKISFEGRTMLRKSSKLRKAEEERLEMERKARMNQPAPSLPRHDPLPGIDSFGGEDASLSSTSPPKPTNFSRPSVTMPPHNNSSSPAYAVASGPTSRANGEYGTDHISRTESMTNRGRYSYASSMAGSGSVSSPRRIRRRKDPTPFNILVIGAKHSGKTSFISLLRHALASPSRGHSFTEPETITHGTKASFTSHYLETEMDSERVGITIWDSIGLEKNIVDLQLREMTAFVESKFEETFAEEQKVVRSPGVKDTHIHCVFLVLDPVRLDSNLAAASAMQTNGGLTSNVRGLDDDLDLQVLRILWGKTTVIPVISKADTLTIGHMTYLKRAVWESIKGARLDPLEALELEDDPQEEDEDAAEEGANGHDGNDSAHDSSDDASAVYKPKDNAHKRQSSLSASIKSSDDESPYIPMSVLSPDPYDMPPYTSKAKGTKSDQIGRRFAWGFADPYNAEHCDFTRLRDSIFSEWRGELRDLSRTKWYENWRTSRLKNIPGSATAPRTKGGVTPASALPKEGLSWRNFSGGSGAAAVPRNASGAGGDATPLSKAERVMGIDRNGVSQNA